MVTAELAACLPVLVLLLAVALSAVSVASARIRAEDAAREAARAAARGDAATAARLARAAAPGATLRTRVGGPDVQAVVSLRVRLPVPFLPVVSVDATAVAAREAP
jgi:Flp pilus assembly protein TadG